MKRYFVDDGIVEEMQSRRWGGIVAEGASGSPPTAGLIMGGDLKEQERHNTPLGKGKYYSSSFQYERKATPKDESIPSLRPHPDSSPVLQRSGEFIPTKNESNNTPTAAACDIREWIWTHRRGVLER
jgi:hypothetical protein